MNREELRRAAREVLERARRPRVRVTAQQKAQLLRELGTTESNVDELLSLEEETD